MHRGMRVATPFAALTITVSLALCGAAAATASTHPRRAQPTAMAGAGITAGRPAVPWRQVGPGWALVTDTTGTPFATHPKPGVTTLYLVDPAGGKYVMYRWRHVPAYGGVSLLSWSGDGTRAMLEVATSPASSAQQLDQLTLATGKLTRLRLPGAVVPIGYTRPDGLAVLAYRIRKSLAEIQLVRYSLSGALEKVVFTQRTNSSNGGGYFNTSQRFSPYSPDGTTIALTVDTGKAKSPEQTLLIGNAGGLIRRYTSAGSCYFERWWTARELLTSDCSGKRLFLTPISGARPKPLTPAKLPSYRYVQGAWSVAGHIYVQETGPACGTGFLTVLRNGHLAGVNVPKLNAGAVVVTASTSRLLIVAQHCMGSSGLLWFDPHTSAETRVLAQNQGQGVVGWASYYQANGGG